MPENANPRIGHWGSCGLEDGNDEAMDSARYLRLPHGYRVHEATRPAPSTPGLPRLTPW